MSIALLIAQLFATLFPSILAVIEAYKAQTTVTTPAPGAAPITAHALLAPTDPLKVALDDLVKKFTP